MKGRKLWKANILICRDVYIKIFNPLAIKQLQTKLFMASANGDRH